MSQLNKNTNNLPTNHCNENQTLPITVQNQQNNSIITQVYKINPSQHQTYVIENHTQLPTITRQIYHNVQIDKIPELQQQDFLKSQQYNFLPIENTQQQILHQHFIPSNQLTDQDFDDSEQIKQLYQQKNINRQQSEPYSKKNIENQIYINNKNLHRPEPKQQTIQHQSLQQQQFKPYQSPKKQQQFQQNQLSQKQQQFQPNQTSQQQQFYQHQSPPQQLFQQHQSFQQQKIQPNQSSQQRQQFHQYQSPQQHLLFNQQNIIDTNSYLNVQQPIKNNNTKIIHKQFMHSTPIKIAEIRQQQLLCEPVQNTNNNINNATTEKKINKIIDYKTENNNLNIIKTENNLNINDNKNYQTENLIEKNNNLVNFQEQKQFIPSEYNKDKESIQQNFYILQQQTPSKQFVKQPINYDPNNCQPEQNLYFDKKQTFNQPKCMNLNKTLNQYNDIHFYEQQTPCTPYNQKIFKSATYLPCKQPPIFTTNFTTNQPNTITYKQRSKSADTRQM